MLRPVIILWTISVNDMSLHLGGLVVLFMLWMHKSWPFWLVSDQISSCWLAKSTVQHKTQQHKTHTNQHEIPPPYPSAALPSPSRGRPVAPWHWGYQSTQARHLALGLRSTRLVPLFWAPYRYPSKIRETGWELAPWPNLIKTHNNQPEINDSGRRDVGERVHGGWSVWGDVIPSFGWRLGQQKNNIKWITPRPKTATNWWGYTQQPTRNRRAL